MSEPSTSVVIGESQFDVAGVGTWIESHISVFLLIAFVGFIFYIFRKGAFAERLLEYRLKAKELDAKQLDDSRVIADILRREIGPDEPLLPFDDVTGRDK